VYAPAEPAKVSVAVPCEEYEIEACTICEIWVDEEARE